MMNKDDYFKLPRLYTAQSLSPHAVIELESGQAHYLHTVMRRKEGDFVRLFDGHNGEWLGTLKNIGKKTGQIVLEEQLSSQPEALQRIHLLFCPIKKNRLDWMIEKAVELGVTDFHPVISQNTEVRKINNERLTQQIFESAEQCERFEIPTLHPIKKLENILTVWPQTITLYGCLERFQAKPVHAHQTTDLGFIIGPEGGFTGDEKKMIAKHANAITLGDIILRSETAMVKALILLTANQNH